MTAISIHFLLVFAGTASNLPADLLRDHWCLALATISAARNTMDYKALPRGTDHRVCVQKRTPRQLQGVDLTSSLVVTLPTIFLHVSNSQFLVQ